MCTQCQFMLNASDDQVGQSGECPRCGRAYKVPAAEEAAAAEKGRSKLMTPTQMRPRVEEEEIPLADEPPRGKGMETARRSEMRGADGAAEATGHGGEEVKEAAVEEPPATPGGLVVTKEGKVTVVSFKEAKVLDSLEIETIGQELYDLVDNQGRRRMALDFSHVKFLSSQMLGVLMALHKKMAGAEGRVMLCSVRPELQKIFKLVKLEKLLPIVPDRTTAVGVLGLP